LIIGAVTAAVVAFCVLVVLPYTLAGSVPPPGLDVLWRIGGPMSVVLCPVAVGLGAAASSWALWRRPSDAVTRRLHLAVLVVATVFVAFLALGTGQSVLTWWRD
jgi:hypothetical protein